MARFRKFLVALVGAVVGILLLHYGQSNEIVNSIVVLATAAGVYAVPNNHVI